MITLSKAKCLICHSADLINQQPPSLNLDQWTAEVRKMQHAYGAPLETDEMAVIAQYLAVTYGSTRVKDLPKNSIKTQAIPEGVIDVKTLLNNNACLGCHSITEKIVGPSYRDIAAKYSQNTNALSAVMAHIKSGGTGRWGANAMPPFPGLTDAELKALAEFVLKQ
ncbi:MAG: c-type cytochrome [Proteobacteria bacterium]|nr:MAG: c-type cytochrome [Pseudomonadota bacterium]